MNRNKIVRKYLMVDLDKSCTLKDQVQTLIEVPENAFDQFLDNYGKFTEVRSIGYVDRYYNDYGDLIAIQDGISKFYLSPNII